MSAGDLGGDDITPEVRSKTHAGADNGLITLLSDNWPRGDDGGLQIRSGGAIEVDTASLEDAAAGFDGAQQELVAIGVVLADLQSTLRAQSHFAEDAQASAASLSKKIEAVQTEAKALADALRETAYGYEAVELAAQGRAALLAGDFDLAGRYIERLDNLLDAHPGAYWAGLGLQLGYAIMWPSELVRQGTQWGVSLGGEFDELGAIGGGAAVGLLAIGGAAITGMGGTGRISTDARLSGTAGPVSVTPMSTTTGAASAVAPRSLADVTQRMPGAGDSRVRVEKYAMADGSKQFVVYIAGTQSQSVLGGDDPWDNTSNVQLYAGQKSDSYAATQAALAQAGAEPGDTVHVAGFSQGAMIGVHLAVEGGYEVPTVITAASPVEGDFGSDTLSVVIKHSDDPIVGLAGGGFGEQVGSQDSIVAERVADPDPGLDDATLPGHHLSAYRETAAMIDASSDPRVDRVHDRLAELSAAESVTVTEYSATRG